MNASDHASDHGVDQVRIESPRWVRLSLSALVGLVAAAVAFLLVARRWVDSEAAWGATAVFVVLVGAFLSGPEALIIGSEEVRSESGWMRRGYRIAREAVAEVRWDGDPDIFEPPRFTFLGPDGQVVRQVTVEFDARLVLDGLRRFGWPTADLDTS